MSHYRRARSGGRNRIRGGYIFTASAEERAQAEQIAAQSEGAQWNTYSPTVKTLIVNEILRTQFGPGTANAFGPTKRALASASDAAVAAAKSAARATGISQGYATRKQRWSDANTKAGIKEFKQWACNYAPEAAKKKMAGFTGRLTEDQQLMYEYLQQRMASLPECKPSWPETQQAPQATTPDLLQFPTAASSLRDIDFAPQNNPFNAVSAPPVPPESTAARDAYVAAVSRLREARRARAAAVAPTPGVPIGPDCRVPDDIVGTIVQVFGYMYNGRMYTGAGKVESYTRSIDANECVFKITGTMFVDGTANTVEITLPAVPRSNVRIEGIDPPPAPLEAEVAEVPVQGGRRRVNRSANRSRKASNRPANRSRKVSSRPRKASRKVRRR